MSWPIGDAATGGTELEDWATMGRLRKMAVLGVSLLGGVLGLILLVLGVDPGGTGTTMAASEDLRAVLIVLGLPLTLGGLLAYGAAALASASPDV